VRASFAVGALGFGGGTSARSGAAFFTVSGDGSLGYVPGSATVARTLVWVDRQGREEEVAVPHRAYAYPNISPDGTRVALDVRDRERDIWIWNFTGGTFTRLTSDPSPDVHPRWTSDGGRIVFSSSRAGGQNLYWQAADGTGDAERLSESESFQLPTAFSADGTRLVFTDQGRRGDYDIGILQLQGERRPELVMNTTFNEINAEVSPDGRWVAYQADESGRYEIYVRPFPDMASARRLISTTGGTRPVWARSGRELFYLAADGALMAVPVETSPTLTVGAPVKLFTGPYFAVLNGRTYDVAPDGERFLMIKEIGSAADAAPQIIVVENWFEELKARVPTN
jgi:serine/threonine-protein kinase